MKVKVEEMGPDIILRLVAMLNPGNVEVVDRGLHIEYRYDASYDNLVAEEKYPSRMDTSRKIFSYINPTHLTLPEGVDYNPQNERLEYCWERDNGQRSYVSILVCRRYR